MYRANTPTVLEEPELRGGYTEEFQISIPLYRFGLIFDASDRSRQSVQDYRPLGKFDWMRKLNRQRCAERPNTNFSSSH